MASNRVRLVPPRPANLAAIRSRVHWRVDRSVDFPPGLVMNGIAVVDLTRVAVGYCQGNVDVFDTRGIRQNRLENDGVFDAAFLRDGRFVIADITCALRLHDADGTITHTTYQTLNVKDQISLDVDRMDNIYVSYRNHKRVQVFRPSGGAPVKTLSLNITPLQIHSTRSGMLVVKAPQSVAIMDADGNVINTINKTDGDVYPAVDTLDNLCVAWVRPNDGIFSIEEYNLYGLFDGTPKGVMLKDAPLHVPNLPWYYLKCLSVSHLAFSTKNSLHFISRGVGRLGII